MSRGRYLLDSHILIWLDKGSERLKLPVLERLRFAEQRYLSAATAWELSLKQAAGKLTLQKPISAMLGAFNLLELPVTIRHGDQAALLPLHHSDPFDRMLVAQALVEGLILVTADQELAQYGVPVLLV
ncbi:MAG: type II toxin-antitoxin system VapC family toxin [Terracidiphilus sp.]